MEDLKLSIKDMELSEGEGIRVQGPNGPILIVCLPTGVGMAFSVHDYPNYATHQSRKKQVIIQVPNDMDEEVFNQVAQVDGFREKVDAIIDEVEAPPIASPFAGMPGGLPGGIEELLGLGRKDTDDPSHPDNR